MRRAVIVAVIHTSIHPDDDDDDDDDGHRDECPIHRTNETHTHTHTHQRERERKKARKSPSSSLTKKQTNNATNLRINRPSGICMSVVMVST